MLRRVTALQMRKRLSDVMEKVCNRDDQFIVERAGRPVAALVPVWQLELWEKERAAFFGMVDELRARSRRSSAAAIRRDILEAVAAARGLRRRRKTKAPGPARG